MEEKRVEKELFIHKKQKETKRKFVLISVMLAMFMGAIEGTIVSTAMPSIVSELGGFSLYSWVFSSFLLMSTVTVLIYGKLSDLFGRKPIISIGIILFLIGSILCGFAHSMEQLILFRLIQGLGAGSVFPLATTIVGDIYSKDERAKVQGYLSSVWGVSAITGPALGGLLVQFVSWRFVFWINIPIGILSLMGLWLFLHEHIEKRKPSIDYGGAFLLTGSITTFMILLVEGGVRFSWNSFTAIVLMIISGLLFTLFIFQEKKAIEPMMPFDIWSIRSIFIANMVSLTTGVMLIGLSSYLPAFVQGVMERSATVAGFTLTAMSIGWPIASALSGRLLLKIGYFKTCLIGGASLVLGSLFFVTMDAYGTPLWPAVGSFFVGVGMGLTSTAFIVSIQSTVEWQKRGIATASNLFMRNLGNTIGAALLGGILNNRIQTYIAENGTKASKELSLNSVTILLSPEKRKGLTDSVREILQTGLTFSLHSVYEIVLLFALASVLLIVFLPKNE
jgi:EmrB/QacA subfamily drug resistance transporter